jgi:hypothetical protein
MQAKVSGGMCMVSSHCKNISVTAHQICSILTPSLHLVYTCVFTVHMQIQEAACTVHMHMHMCISTCPHTYFPSNMVCIERLAWNGVIFQLETSKHAFMRGRGYTCISGKCMYDSWHACMHVAVLNMDTGTKSSYITTSQ